jgi:dipeptidyl aminopeptidase/acylaminoacyl peptidase
VVAFYPGFDLADGYRATQDGRVAWYARSRLRSVLVDYLGGTLEEHPERYRAASPAQFVSADDPPLLVVHGEKDNIAPISQSENIVADLSKCGVRAELVRVPGEGHGFIKLDHVDVMESVYAFLDQELALR